MANKVYHERKHYPFRTLKHKIAYIKRSGVSFGDMFTEDGNKALKNAIQKVVDFILDDEKKLNRKKAILSFSVRLKTLNMRVIHSL